MADGTYEARRQRGLDVLRTLTGVDDVEARAQQLEDSNGALGSFIVDFALGEIFSRPGLSRRDRSLVVISVLAALSERTPLKVHVRGAVNHGMTPEEVREVMTHLSGYAGFPRAVEAMRVTNEVLADMGHAPENGKLPAAERLSDAERWSRGAQGLNATAGANVPAIRPDDDGNGPAGLGPLGGIAVEFCFGDIWGRSQLSRRDRSVLVVSVLAALGRQDELKIHIPAALSNGVTVVELEEMIVTYAAFAGFPFAVECRSVLMRHLKKQTSNKG